MNKEKRVLVGMSGGVDSSVSAALLKDQGYEVIGITIAPFDLGKEYMEHYTAKGCLGKTNLDDAAQVCEDLGIKHIIVDYSNTFKTNVAEYFIEEYLAGRTPNPCVQCNPVIKWGKLLETADDLECSHIATGHYAKIEKDNSKYILKKAKDRRKDQTYFLWKLTSKQLARTIFPLGHLTKTETRKIAEEKELKIFKKQESQEVCFIPDNDYRNFLELFAGSSRKLPGEGNIIFMNQVAGTHKGYPFYTIGQRKGLGVTYKEPLYVKRIDAEENQVIVGRQGELFNDGLLATGVNLHRYRDELAEPKEFIVKIRYKDPGNNALCSITGDGKLKVEFPSQTRAITPGQSVVMYEDETLIGGGIIEEWF